MVEEMKFDTYMNIYMEEVAYLNPEIEQYIFRDLYRKGKAVVGRYKERKEVRRGIETIAGTVKKKREEVKIPEKGVQKTREKERKSTLKTYKKAKEHAERTTKATGEIKKRLRGVIPKEQVSKERQKTEEEVGGAKVAARKAFYKAGKAAAEKGRKQRKITRLKRSEERIESKKPARFRPKKTVERKTEEKKGPSKEDIEQGKKEKEMKARKEIMKVGAKLKPGLKKIWGKEAKEEKKPTTPKPTTAKPPAAKPPAAKPTPPKTGVPPSKEETRKKILSKVGTEEAKSLSKTAEEEVGKPADKILKKESKSKKKRFKIAKKVPEGGINPRTKKPWGKTSKARKSFEEKLKKKPAKTHVSKEEAAVLKKIKKQPK